MEVTLNHNRITHLSPDAECWDELSEGKGFNFENHIKGVLLYPCEGIKKGGEEDVQTLLEELLDEKLSEAEVEQESFEIEYVGKVLNESGEECFAFSWSLVSYNLFGFPTEYEATIKL